MDPGPEVSAELSMAWNHMGDDALGRLLQALQRSQVRVRSLKFCGNSLSPEGGHKKTQGKVWRWVNQWMGVGVGDVLFVLGCWG